jgi:phosphatidylserine/phosphatidylglycerophosphate/cardiolipin synthase-like enzyme
MVAATVGVMKLQQVSLPVAAAVTEAPVRPASIVAYFSPNGGCTDAIVNELNCAKATIDVQAYSFTSAPIAEAVAKAHARGVKVRVILDKSQQTERYSSLTYLRNHNVPTWVDSKHAIAHNKLMIIDGRTLLTGSFNFSKAAEERNAENLLVIRDNAELIRQYQDNFKHHLEHAVQ